MASNGNEVTRTAKSNHSAEKNKPNAKNVALEEAMLEIRKLKEENKVLEKLKGNKKVEEAETLELAQKLHEIKINGIKELRKMDEEQFQAEKELLLRRARENKDMILQTAALNTSLMVEDKFYRFQQNCHRLRRAYSIFNKEYDFLEPELIRADDSMSRKEELNACDLDDLLSALRQFNEQAHRFSTEGAEDEAHHRIMIEKIIELISKLFEDINNMKAIFEIYTEHLSVENNQHQGILQRRNSVAENRDSLRILMQHFVIIERDHVRETLAIQMAEHSMVEQRRLENGSNTE